MPRSGSYVFCFTNPGSTTNLTPGTVRDVSAMFVASTTFRTPGAHSSNAACCACEDSAPYSGTTVRPRTAPSEGAAAGSPDATASSMAALAFSISSWPVRNTSTCPADCVRCSLSTSLTLASMYLEGRASELVVFAVAAVEK